MRTGDFTFIDTNVLLHYKRISEIDWLSLLQVKALTIIFPPAVIRELDKQKVMHSNQKIRKRAQDVTSELFSCRKPPGSEIRKNVTVEFLPADPKIDFAKHQLRPELADDWIIASILEWKASNPAANVTLVSADLGISITR